MGIARGENTVRVRIARIFLNGQEQLRRRFVKLAFEEMGFADQAQGRTHSLEWAQPQRGLGMLDREIVLTGPEPENATQKPAAGEARGEHEGPVDQRHHGTDILAEIGEDKGSVDQDAWVVLRHLESLPGKIYGLAAGGLRLFGPVLSDEPHLTHRRQRQCRTTVPSDRYRLLQRFQSLE